MNEINDYWSDIDKRLENLSKKGFTKLPSLKKLDIDKLSNEIVFEMENSTFKESGKAHEKLLNYLQINNFLTPKLFELARNKFFYKGEKLNQYHVARLVLPGNSKEKYRAHFDSHLFTLVLPIKIPIKLNDEIHNGELIFFPNVRKLPANELINLIQKLYFKIYANEKGIKRLMKKREIYVESFESFEPILFFGKTFLHTNHPVSKHSAHERLTLLSHFFDTSPKFGVGNILRILRKR
tara:strand:+ start:15646 stop:16359 length:714 start_codon:yes stop_codon:yes gene_type:complete